MIHIIYRHTEHIRNCGVNKNRPNWFSYDACLDNILSTIENIDFVKFHLIYDGNINIIKPDNRIHNIVCINEGSPMGSWIKAWDYAKTLDLEENDLIYHLENDYLHLDGWPYEVQTLFKTYNNIDYITLYDHPDKYNHQIYPDLVTSLFLTDTHHWRWIPSATGTFITTKKILFEDYDIWTSGPGDHPKFLWLGQNRQRVALSPIPSLSTHCEIEWIAPTINWGIINKKINK